MAERWGFPIPCRARLITEGALPGVDVARIRDFLREASTFGELPVEILPLPLPARTSDAKGEELARSLAAARIHDPLRPPAPSKPMDLEVKAEEKRIDDPDSAGPGMVYDGVEVLHLFSALAGGRHDDFESLEIIFTNRVVGTWDHDDHRIHARVALFAFPSLISIPGLVAAPAPPREEALARRLGLAPVPGTSQGGPDRLIHGDPRTTEVLCGIVLQALFYHLTGNPFCDDPDCRLFNAHRQEDLLRAQQGSGTGLCGLHENRLRDFRR